MWKTQTETFCISAFKWFVAFSFHITTFLSVFLNPLRIRWICFCFGYFISNTQFLLFFLLRLFFTSPLALMSYYMQKISYFCVSHFSDKFYQFYNGAIKYVKCCLFYSSLYLIPFPNLNFECAPTLNIHTLWYL